MRRITKNSSLCDLAPDLIKEWHPSANGSLTPRNVRISHSRKVWWICNQSHEWRATIKSRMKGYGCPLCGKGNAIKFPHVTGSTSTQANSNSEFNSNTGAAATIFEPEAFDGNFEYDFRKSRRYKMTATAVLESPSTGHWVYAEVKNYSAGGMRLESDSCIDPGTKVTINLDRPLFISDRKKYDSIIRWCRLLDIENPSSSTHGMGAKFI